MARDLSLRLKEHNLLAESSFVKDISQALVNRDAIYLVRNKVLRGGLIRVLGNIFLLIFLRNMKDER
jgi:hypothetical protein